MKSRFFLSACLAVLAVAGAATAARADTLTLTLEQNVQSVLQGTASVAFYATISNPSATDTIYLNGDSFSTTSLYLTVDDTPYFSNAPLWLAPLASSGPFELFAVDLAPGTPVGDYTLNDFSITGGPDGGSFTDFYDLADANFAVDVTASSSPVPEPATGALLGSGLLLLAGLAEKRRRASR